MKKLKTIIYIVDDDQLMAISLKQFLEIRFGDSVRIEIFNDGESCLKEMHNRVDVVILDYFMKDKNGLEVLKSIKAINPKTEVIMLSSNEDIEAAIKLFRAGAKDYVVKGDGSWDKIIKLVAGIITKPIRIIVKGFVKQFVRLS